MQPIAQTCGALTESPFWHPDEQALYWCDIDGRQIGRRTESAAGAVVQHWPMPAEPGCIAPLRDGGLIVAMRDGIYRFDPDEPGAVPERLLAAPYDTTRFRFNDGRCDGAGRLLVGTLNEAKSASDAQLYQVWREGQAWHCDAVAGGVMTANGLAFSPDGQCLYWADTRAHRVDCFDYSPATGSLGRRREFVAFSPPAANAAPGAYGGRPDGAAVDAEGFYWVAMWEGAQLLRISPAGEIVQRLPVPVQCPTMPCFGGADLRTLYVTSASKGRPAAELAVQPGAGGLFSTQVAVPGLPVAFCG